MLWTDDHLVYCEGVAFQKDMSALVDYGEAYFNNYVERTATPIAVRLNEARTGLTERFCKRSLLDVGIGSGEFICSSRLKVYGYDINPYGVRWLRERGLYLDPYVDLPDEVEGLTLWDTLEHIPDPQSLFGCLRSGMYFFVSLPTFGSIAEVRDSKHFKPNEHLYYFTISGFIRYMSDSGFQYLTHNDDETRAGRDGITAFAFQYR
jgi:SAM-dependent methyltransferase